MANPRWVISSPDIEAASKLAREFGLSRISGEILVSRLDTPTRESAEMFLHPKLTGLRSPWDMAGMEVAAGRIAEAVKKQEKIVVHGDYDTDGVTASAVIIQVLKALGADIGHYLPCRLEQGYGISEDFVEYAIAEKVGLVITVDCGISEHQKISALREAGIDVVVTDHHEPGDEALPDATAVVDPKRADCPYEFRELVGVGVAFKLAWAVCEKYVGQPRLSEKLRELLLSQLATVAIGTIADVAPLVDENRILVSYGIKALKRPSAGIKALLDVSRQKPESITARDIAFSVSPRINAAGRMGKAELALHLLLEENEIRARDLALQLDSENRDRQTLCQDILAAAKEEVDSTFNPKSDGAVVVAGEGWHDGVIGIVSGRLSDEHHLPALVIAFQPGKEVGRGSARSIPGINLYEALSLSRECFETFGGHEQAAGFSIRREMVPRLREELNAYCRSKLDAGRFEPKIDIDIEIPLGEITPALANELEMFAPFGEGNPTPCFLSRGIRIAGEPRLLGSSGRHFSFNASQDSNALRAVAFNHIEWLQEIDSGHRDWDIVFHVEQNNFYSPARIELKIVDMRPSL